MAGRSQEKTSNRLQGSGISITGFFMAGISPLMKRRIVYAGLGLVALAVFVCVAAIVVVQTDWFRNYVKQKIIATTEEATGGKVDIGSFSFDVRHLKVVVTNFVIHGKEPASASPLVSAARVEVDLRLLSSFKNIVGVSYLGVEKPAVNVMVLADGSTNIPSPKEKQPESKTTALETVVDLAVGHFNLANGSLALNAQKEQFDLQGNNLRAELWFNQLTNEYAGQLGMEPIYVAAGRNTPVKVRLTLPLTLQRDRVILKNGSIATDASQIALNGSLDNVRDPRVSAHISGNIALSDLKNAANLPLVLNGRNVPATMAIDANAQASSESIQVTGLRLSLGHSNVEASGPLKDPHGAGGLQFKSELVLGELGRLVNVGVRPEGTLTLNGTATMDAANRYEVAGNLQASHVSFTHGKQKIVNLSLSSTIHADPELVALQGLSLSAFGGEFHGDLSLKNFEKYEVKGNLSRLDLQTVAEALAQQQLPYSGVIAGPVTASGDLKAAGTQGILAQTNLSISPGKRGIPVSGKLDAGYNGSADSVSIAKSYVALPHTRLDIDGSLNRRLNITLTSRDLNDLLASGSPPTKSPVVFDGGQAVFAGTVMGTLTNPKIAGHLDVTKFSVEGREFQSLGTDVIASPSKVALQSGRLTRASTQAQFDGSIGLLNWKPVPKEPVLVNASVNTNDLADLAVLAGQLPAGYSGTLNGTAHIEGTVGNPRGTVNVQAAQGMLDGSAFDQAALLVNLTDQLVTIPSGFITSGPARVTLTGDFRHPKDSFTSGQVHAHLQSDQLDLAKVNALQKQQPNSGGVVRMDADLAGDLSTVRDETQFLLSRVNAQVSAKGLKFQGQNYGDLTATAKTNGNTVAYNVNSDFAGSDLRVTGSTQLVRDYPTTADANISHLPIERLLTLAKEHVPARGSLSGTAHLAGNVANPTGNLNLDLAHAVVYDEPLDHVRVRVTYLSNAVEVSSAEVAMGQERIDLSGRFDHPVNDFKSGSLQFKINSTRIDLAKIRNAQKLRPGLGGTLQLTANGAGSLRPGSTLPEFSTLSANLGLTNLSVQKNVFGNLTLKADTVSGNRTNVLLDSNLAGSKIHGEGWTQLGGDYPMDAKVTFNDVTWEKLQPLLGATTGEPPSFAASTEGMITVNGPAMKTDRLRGLLQVTKLNVDTLPHPGMRRVVGIHNQGPIQLALANGLVKIESAHIVGPQTDIQATGSASLTQQTLDVDVNANANLALAQSFSQDIVSSGAIVATARVRGAFSNPQVNGQLQLQKASLNYTGFSNGISNANGTIVFNGSNATIRNLEGESGGGRLTASGFVGYTDQIRFGLRTRGSNVRIRIEQGVSVVMDADVRLSGTTTASTISGTATVTDLTYSPQSDIGALLSRSNTPVQTESAPNPLLNNMKLDIRVVTSASLGVQASVAQNLQATADLRVRGTAAQPGVLGRVNITEGQLVFFGSTYTVNSGSIGFYNPLRIEPVLNISLETQAKGVDVVISVTGPIDNMKLSYTSDPPLQFQEIVGLLASGKTPTSDPTILANQPAQPSQSYEQMGESAIVGKALADPVTNRLQRVFGITQLKIDPAFVSGSQLPTAQLTFQQQISTNVTFTYTSALDDPNSTIIRAEWSFNPQYSAVAMRDQNGLVSVLLYYKRQIR